MHQKTYNARWSEPGPFYSFYLLGPREDHTKQKLIIELIGLTPRETNKSNMAEGKPEFFYLQSQSFFFTDFDIMKLQFTY